MPTLKGTEASLSCVQCFLYHVSSSIDVSIFHSTWLDVFWTDLVYLSDLSMPGSPQSVALSGRTKVPWASPHEATLVVSSLELLQTVQA